MERLPRLLGPASLLVRIVIGAAFIYAGILKASDPAAFAIAIEGYQLVPYRFAYFTALYLPFLEILSGALLIVKRTFLPAATILTALMIIFTLALITAWARGLDIDCGCFGKSGATTEYPGALLRNMGLLSGLAFLLWAEKYLTIYPKT